MTNDPASIVAALRTLAVYAVCCVLAIILGVMMTNPLTYSSLGFVAVLCAAIFIPFLLRWHYPLMILCLSSPIVAFFIKGAPQLCLVVTTISLAISIAERTLNQRHFINVPWIALPLLCLIGIVATTASLTGGIGLHAFGSDVYGGKKYVFLIVGILGYFAMTSRRIPPEKAQKYVAYFFLGGVLSCVGDFASITPRFLQPIYWLIPPYFIDSYFDVGTTRLVGTAFGAMALLYVLMARYGLRGIFLSGTIWRPVVFFMALGLVFLGGFRSALIMIGLTVTIQFFLEGMHRTRLMPFFIILALAGMAAAIPMASKLPFTFQRTLAFVPESMLHLSTDARLAAEGSTQWRLDMWQALLPQIPKHLLLGKGYAISSDDLALMGTDSAFHSSDAADQGLALSGDYHSGPLSVILPFGIWGVIVFLWFLYASITVVYRNFRYGPTELRTANTFIFTYYVVIVFTFFFLAGALNSDMQHFTALLGLSIAINGGVCRAPVRPQKNFVFKHRPGLVRPQIRPAFQRGAAGAHPQ